MARKFFVFVLFMLVTLTLGCGDSSAPSPTPTKPDALAATQPADADSDADGEAGEPATTQPADAAEPAAFVPSETPLGGVQVVSIKGLHCGGCASAVKGKLASMEGVEECDVILEKEQATLKLADGGPSQKVIAEAITKLGYKVTAIEAGS